MKRLGQDTRSAVRRLIRGIEKLDHSMQVHTQVTIEQNKLLRDIRIGQSALDDAISVLLTERSAANFTEVSLPLRDIPGDWSDEDLDRARRELGN